MAFCASCGRQLAEDARFCDGCGATQGAQQPPVAAPQAQYAAAPQPQRGKSPLIAVIAIILLAVLGGGVWWFASNRPMSEAEYKKAAEEVVFDFIRGSDAFLMQDSDSFGEFQKTTKAAADDWNDMLRRAKDLRPPQAFADTNADLIAAIEPYADLIGRISQMVQESSNEDDLQSIYETAYAESDENAWNESEGKLESVLKDLDIDSADANTAQGGASSNAQERTCFANERTLEGAAQTYLADDANNSLSHLDGSGWENALVPYFVREVPTCPTSGESYTMRNGTIDCPTHGHW